MKNKFNNPKKSIFSIRKLSLGCISCLIGCFIFFGGSYAFANNIVETENNVTYDDDVVKDKNKNIETEVNEISERLKEKTYDSESVQNKYSSGRIPTTEKTQKALEIMKRDKVDYNTANTKAEKELKAQRGEDLDFKDSYNKVYGNIKEETTDILENSKDSITTNKAKIENNSTEFMIGLTYLERLYNFNVYENMTAKDVLVKHIDYFNQNKGSNVDLILEVGKQSTDNLDLRNSSNVYEKVISKYTGKKTIFDFLESFVPENKDVNEWYKEKSNAYIEEVASNENPNLEYKLYNKLKSEDNLKKYVLPLLNVSKESVYVASNATTITLGMYETYAEKGSEDEFKEKLKEASKKQGNFIDFWLRIAKEEDKNKLSSAKVVIDTMMKKAKTTNETASNRWSTRRGEGVTKAVKEFFGPLGQYSTYKYIGGQAEGSGMRLFVTSALEDDGLSTYTHELTHLLDKEVWFNGGGRRDGLEVEFYARGLFESYELHNEPIYNLNLIYEKDKNRYTNSSPTRFSTEEDLKNYMKGVMDVTYLLDFLEAENILTRDVLTKQKWFNQHNQVIDTSKRANAGTSEYTHTNDDFKKIDVALAGKLNSINDLVDNNIVVARYEFKGRQSIGVAKANDYYVIPLFTPDYSTAENENGVSGDVITRRLAYELLAEYGYHNGMVPYLSNKYKENSSDKITDKIVFTKLLKGESIKEFKKRMFNERLNKEIKPVKIILDGNEITINNLEQLKNLVNEAIEKDLKVNVTEVTTGGITYNNGVLPKNTNIEKLKAAFYNSALNSTNDFRTSIFKNKPKVTINYKYNEEIIKTEEVEIENGEVRYTLPQAKNGEYVLGEFDINKLKNITEDVTIEIPIKHTLPAMTLTPATKEIIKVPDVAPVVDDLPIWKETIPALTLTPAEKEIIKVPDVAPVVDDLPTAKIPKVTINYKHNEKIIKTEEVEIENGEVRYTLPQAENGEYVLGEFDKNKLKNITEDVTIEIPLKLNIQALTLTPATKEMSEVPKVAPIVDDLPIWKETIPALTLTPATKEIIKVPDIAPVVDDLPTAKIPKVTINYKYNEEIIKTEEVEIENGEVRYTLPQAKNGEYVLGEFDINKLKNITEDVTIEIPIKHTLPAMTLTPATKEIIKVPDVAPVVDDLPIWKETIPALTLTPAEKEIIKVPDVAPVVDDLPTAKIPKVTINYKHNEKIIKTEEVEIENGEVRYTLPQAENGEYVLGEFDKNKLKNITEDVTIEIPIKHTLPAMTLTPATKEMSEVPKVAPVVDDLPIWKETIPALTLTPAEKIISKVPKTAPVVDDLPIRQEGHTISFDNDNSKKRNKKLKILANTGINNNGLYSYTILSFLGFVIYKLRRLANKDSN